jgi:hypothetical protein
MSAEAAEAPLTTPGTRIHITRRTAGAANVVMQLSGFCPSSFARAAATCYWPTRAAESVAAAI